MSKLKSFLYSTLFAAGLTFSGCTSSIPESSLDNIVNETNLVKVDKRKNKENKKQKEKKKEWKKLDMSANRTSAISDHAQEHAKSFSKAFLDIKLPPIKFDEEFLINPTFDHSEFGLKTNTKFVLTEGFKLNFLKGTISYGNSRFKVTDDLEKSLLGVVSRNKNYYSTLLDPIAGPVLEFKELSKLKFGFFTVPQVYDLCRLFAPLFQTDKTSNGGSASSNIKLRGYSDTEEYTSNYFRTQNGKLIRQKHGLRLFLDFKSELSPFYNIKYGKGIGVPLGGLEKLIDSRLSLTFDYLFHTNFSLSESFEHAVQTEKGWQGMGVVHDWFYYFNEKGRGNLFADATLMEQIKYGRFFYTSVSESYSKIKKDGKFNLVYFFRNGDFGKFWYSSYIGFNKQDYEGTMKDRYEKTEVRMNFKFKFQEKTSGYSSPKTISEHGIGFEHGGLVGFDIGIIHPFFRWTTFPEKEIVSGFYFNTPLVGRFSISSEKKDMEFLFPVFDEKNRERLMKMYRKTENVLASPFRVRGPEISNIRRRAFSDIDGNFLRVSNDENFSTFGFLHALDGEYSIGYGANLGREDSFLGAYINTGIKNVGILASYSYVKDDVLKNKEHNFSLDLSGEFDKYFFNLYVKGLVIGNTNTSLYEYHNSKDVRFLLSFGGIFY